MSETEYERRQIALVNEARSEYARRSKINQAVPSTSRIEVSDDQAGPSISHIKIHDDHQAEPSTSQTEYTE